MFRWLLVALMAATCQACPPGYDQHDLHCYQFNKGVVRSWFDANNDCKMNGATLTNMDEHDYISERLRTFVSCNAENNLFWIGYVQDADGSSINAADVGLLTNPTNCEAIWGFNGARNWFPCNNMDSHVRGWICKKNIE